MTLRIFGYSLFSFVLVVAFVAATTPAISSMNVQDDRAADREAIRAHIDSIFQAFIKKDAAALRATHAQNWLGYLEGSRTMIKGDAAFVCFVADVESVTPNGPYHRALRISDFYTKQNGQWIQNGSDTALHQESVEEQLASPRPVGDQNEEATAGC